MGQKLLSKYSQFFIDSIREEFGENLLKQHFLLSTVDFIETL